jgi:hypothetical protein
MTHALTRTGEELTCTALDTHHGKWEAVHAGCCAMLSQVECFERDFAGSVDQWMLLLSRERIECTADEMYLVARMKLQ